MERIIKTAHGTISTPKCKFYYITLNGYLWYSTDFPLDFAQHKHLLYMALIYAGHIQQMTENTYEWDDGLDYTICELDTKE